MQWSDLDPPASDEEAFRWHKPHLVLMARRARAREEKRGIGPSATLLRLAYCAVGTSHLFTKYRRSTQLSTAIREAWLRTGAEFTTALERDLVTGDIVGVRVTLTKTATRGERPLTAAEMVERRQAEQRAAQAQLDAQAEHVARTQERAAARAAERAASPPFPTMAELLK